ncbi:MAG: hypothetical protein Q9222_005595 [Ikaeria aurantiellina]
MLDVLLSHNGILGTRRPTIHNNSRKKQKIPPIYFSNPDLLWSSSYHVPRLGQGAFQAAFRGVWDAVTNHSIPLNETIIGKPSQDTFEFAEKRLRKHRASLLGLSPPAEESDKLKTIYMIGDNPSSDIQGGNSYRSPYGTGCETLLVRSGVFGDEDASGLAHKPSAIVNDVHDAVTWALERESWS